MMEFTDEQNMLRETIRNFAVKEVAPLAYEIDRDERFPVERMMRDAKLQTIGGGISEIQRMIIAREILGL